MNMYMEQRWNLCGKFNTSWEWCKLGNFYFKLKEKFIVKFISVKAPKFLWPTVLGLPSTGQRKKNWDILFCPIRPKNIRPNPIAGSDIIGGLLASELQNDKHPRVPSIRGCENLLCLISINSPTRFARRGIKLQLDFWSGRNCFEMLGISHLDKKMDSDQTNVT